MHVRSSKNVQWNSSPSCHNFPDVWTWSVGFPGVVGEAVGQKLAYVGMVV